MEYLLGVIASIIFLIYNGLIIKYLWAWFIMPLDTTLPALTIPMAMGLSLFLSYTCQYCKLNIDDKPILPYLIKFFMYSTFLFVCGAIIQMFV